jgi:transposase-like protein
MTSTTSTDSANSLPVAIGQGALLKMDTQGRVRTSKERRQAILAEFDQSGVSGAQFAKLAGIRYSTFAGWRQRRRNPKLGKGVVKTIPTAARRPTLRLVEALIDPATQGGQTPDQGLVLHLPGGVRLELTSQDQVPMAVALVQALQPPAARC